VAADGEAAVGRRPLPPRAGRGGEREESREVGAHCPAAHSEKTHPRRSGDGLAPAPLMRSATIPPARDLQVARTKTSPGFGRAARLPGRSHPVASSRYSCPSQWRGPAGLTPASVGPPSPVTTRVVYPGFRRHATPNPIPSPRAPRPTDDRTPAPPRTG